MIKHTRLILLGLLLFAGNVSADSTPSAWNKVKDKNGISVYTMAVESSQIVRVKTSTVINASMKEIQAIITSHAQRNQWVPYLVESRILNKLNGDEQLEYAHFSAPWPASDRDFVYHVKQLKLDKNTTNFAMHSKYPDILEQHDDIIRADLIESQYSLQRISDTSTRVELVFHADPKGWLPFWIINIIQKALPYMMLNNLKILAENGGLHK